MSDSQIVSRSAKRGAIAGGLLAFSYILLIIAVLLIRGGRARNGANGDEASTLDSLIFILGVLIVGPGPAIVLGGLTGFIVAKMALRYRTSGSLAHGLQGLAVSLGIVSFVILLRTITDIGSPYNILEYLWAFAIPVYFAASFWMGRRVHFDLHSSQTAGNATSLTTV